MTITYREVTAQDLEQAMSWLDYCHSNGCVFPEDSDNRYRKFDLLGTINSGVLSSYDSTLAVDTPAGFDLFSCSIPLSGERNCFTYFAIDETGKSQGIMQLVIRGIPSFSDLVLQVRYLGGASAVLSDMIHFIQNFAKQRNIHNIVLSHIGCNEDLGLALRGCGFRTYKNSAVYSSRTFDPTKMSEPIDLDRYKIERYAQADFSSSGNCISELADIILKMTKNFENSDVSLERNYLMVSERLGRAARSYALQYILFRDTNFAPVAIFALRYLSESGIIAVDWGYSSVNSVAHFAPYLLNYIYTTFRCNNLLVNKVIWQAKERIVMHNLVSVGNKTFGINARFKYVWGSSKIFTW